MYVLITEARSWARARQLCLYAQPHFHSGMHAGILLEAGVDITWESMAEGSMGMRKERSKVNTMHLWMPILHKGFLFVGEF